MSKRPALVTGFEPYGGRGSNPAYEVARVLDGKVIRGTNVVGRTLPVSYAQLKTRILELVRTVDPAVVISLGLWPGEPMIRIERVGLNLADFEIADNDGAFMVDQPVGPDGPTARTVTLPVRRIEAELLAAGIPARLSATAGTFLCNACLYDFLEAVAAQPYGALCGFLHLPYSPVQVAEMLAAAKRERRLELHQRADLASMALDDAVKAVGIALDVALAEADVPVSTL